MLTAAWRPWSGSTSIRRAGARGILDQIEAAICTLLHRMMLSPHDVRGIGVGFGGPVDVSRGRVHTSYQVEGWTDFPLAEKLRRSTGIAAVVIENDADTAGLAEARFGAGVGCSPLLYLTIGSGIGRRPDCRGPDLSWVWPGSR